MSETRPPITAGPIARAFKFLKRTSVSWTGVGAADVGAGAGRRGRCNLGRGPKASPAAGGGETMGANSSS
jgi:hypothetical protein